MTLAQTSAGRGSSGAAGAGSTLSNGSTISGTGGSPGPNTANALTKGTTGANLGGPERTTLHLLRRTAMQSTRPPPIARSKVSEIPRRALLKSSRLRTCSRGAPHFARPVAAVPTLDRKRQGPSLLRHRDIRRFDQFVTNNRVPKDRRAFEPEHGTRAAASGRGATTPPKVPVPLLLCVRVWPTLH